MNLNNSRDIVKRRTISSVTPQQTLIFLKRNHMTDKMKMDEQLIKSKKRVASLWRRILRNKVINNVVRDESENANESACADKSHKFAEDSEFDKENSSSEKASEEDLTKVHSYLIQSSSSPCPPTILKKSQTDPAYQHTTPSSGRHATFKEIVKVHYLVQDSLGCEEHYYSEASLTDDDDHAMTNKGFFVDNYPEQDEEASQDEAPKRFDTRKLITEGERANIFRRLDGYDDMTEDSDEASLQSPEKSKTKTKKSSKSKSKKKKMSPQRELQDDDAFFNIDFGC